MPLRWCCLNIEQLNEPGSYVQKGTTPQKQPTTQSMLSERWGKIPNLDIV